MENIKGPTNVPTGLQRMRSFVERMGADIPLVDGPAAFPSEAARVRFVEWLGLYLRSVPDGWHEDWSMWRLSGIKLEDARLAGVQFCGTDLSKAPCAGANFNKGVLSQANLLDADLRKVQAWAAYFDNAEMQNCDLRDACLADASLVKAKLVGANLCGADLSRADMRGAELRDIRFNASTNWLGAKMEGTCYEGAKLPQHGHYFGNIRKLETKLAVRASWKGVLSAIKRLFG